MIKKGRKGRISNELVAASCAAILTVYTAGYLRTRDAAGRFGTDGQTRPVRPLQPAQIPVSVSVPMPNASVPVEVAASAPKSAAPVSATAIKTQPVAKSSPKSGIEVTPAPAAVAVAVAEKPEPAAEIAVAAEEAETPAPAHKPWLDGYYTGWGTSRHGDIQAFVTIEGGRIINAGIATCETRYPCSVIDYILRQPIDLQGPNVDAVSRATESADAYYTGLVRALENAETGTFRSSRP